MYFAARRIISSPRSIYNTTSFPILHDVDGDGGSRSQTDDSRCRPLVDEYFWFTSSDNMQVANNACRVTGVTRRESVLQGRRAHRNISEPFFLLDRDATTGCTRRLMSSSSGASES
jgi:hypothetical protein